VSVDLELWTRETADLAPLLPRPDEWEPLGGSYELDGDGWLVSVFEPEDAAGEVPGELRELVDGLRYRIDIGVEPSAPGADAWLFVREVLDALGTALGGAWLDPESGRPTSPDG
jgi:hypothetical protein